MDDAAAGSRGQIEKRRIDNALQIGRRPGLMVENIKFPQILKDARA